MSDRPKDLEDLSPEQKRRLLKELLEKKAQRAPPKKTPPAVRPAKVLAAYAQERLWFLEGLHPNNADSKIGVGYHLKGEVDPRLLEAALRAVLDRHEILRTRLEVDGDRLYQVLNEGPWSLEVEALGAQAEGEGLAEARARAHRRVLKGFDRGAPWLFQGVLYPIDPRQSFLLILMHGALADGWSLGVFWNDLAAAYDALQSGVPDPRPPLPLQFADFSTWERDWLTGPVRERATAYWRKALLPLPPPLDLSGGKAPPSPPTFLRGEVQRTLSPALGAEVRRLAQTRATSSYAVLLAAFEAVLSLQAGQREFLVGTPVRSHLRPNTEGMIGRLQNTILIRAQVDETLPFEQLLRSVRSASLDAMSHQDLPFEDVVAAVAPSRDRESLPLLQVVFGLFPMGRALTLGGATATPEPVEAGTLTVDLSCQVLEQLDGGLRAMLVFRQDLFEPAQLERLLLRWEQVVAQACAAPSTEVRALTRLAGEERRQVLGMGTGQAVQFDGPALLHQRFEGQARAAPEATALQFGDTALSYGELDRRANGLAHALRARGVGRERFVAVHLERSLELLIALYAILKAGGAYLPLAPDLPPERLAFLLQDAQPVLVLTCEGGTEALPPGTATLELSLAALAAKGQDAPPRFPTHAEDPAYCIYTSGSTGVPKGVTVTHRGIVNRLCWMQAAYPLDARDGVLQKTPFGFDVSVWELFWPLAQGARLVIAAPGGHQDPRYLEQVLRVGQITTAHFVPSMLQTYLDQDGALGGALRQVFCSGEALPRSLARRFRTRAPGVALHNLYGPTEASVDVTAWSCDGEHPWGSEPIGFPIANVQVHLLDPTLEPVPRGAPGEIYLGGAGLSRGYHRRPALTADRFVPDPHGAPGGRLYRTGDRGRLLEDGSVEYLGRLDHQLKLRGNRVELGEIEEALRQLPEVKDAAAGTFSDADGALALVGYLVGPAASDIAGWRERLSQRLPSYMIPARFVRLDALPLSANGKLDRRALPPPGEEGAPAQAEPPRDALERALAQLVAQLIKLPGVGRDEDFFQIGGHSMLAMRLLFLVQRSHGVEVPLRAFMERPTVSQLAALVRARAPGGG